MKESTEEKELSHRICTVRKDLIDESNELANRINSLREKHNKLVESVIKGTQTTYKLLDELTVPIKIALEGGKKQGELVQTLENALQYQKGYCETLEKRIEALEDRLDTETLYEATKEQFDKMKNDIEDIQHSADDLEGRVTGLEDQNES